MHTPHLRTATYYALTAALVSGVSVFINKYAIAGTHDPVLFATLKNGIVGLFLAGSMLATHTHRELALLTRAQWRQLCLVGLVGGSIPFALFFTGLSMTTAVNGAFIHKTLFVWVAIASAVFLRERFSPLQWLGVGVLVAANAVLGGLNDLTGSTGEILILTATLLWAGEHLVAKRALRDLSAVTVASARMLFGSAALFVFLAATGRITHVADLVPTHVGWTLLTAAFLLAYNLTWYAALKRAPASYVAALLVPATLVTTLLTAMYTTQTLTPPQVFSGILTVLGTTLLVWLAHRAVGTRSHTTQPLALPG